MRACISHGAHLLVGLFVVVQALGVDGEHPLAQLPGHVLLVVLPAHFFHELVSLGLGVRQTAVLFPSNEKTMVLVPAGISG